MRAIRNAGVSLRNTVSGEEVKGIGRHLANPRDEAQCYEARAYGRVLDFALRVDDYVSD